ncbi:hypothetical protein QQ054_33735 [Oscillatoria amoena NRMC-F 0135]|nr:hypothetical protein [Oscillatoria amoena NRMC-F 0135]
MKELEFKEIANAKISTRLKQVIVLAIVILLGILFSTVVNAQEPRHKVIKSKTSCQQLARKRNQSDNIRVSVKKVKYKPMAEMESPAAYRTSSRKEKEDKTLKR